MADPTTPPWLTDPITTPAQSSPFGTRPVIQSPPPQKDTFSPLPKTDPRYRPEYPSAQVNNTTGEINFGPQAPATDDHAASKQQAMEATHELIQSIEKARGYVNDANNSVVGNTATGLGYNLLHNSPVATDASQLDATIKGEVQGNIFKSWMSAMKAATDKGGSAFGGRIMQSEIPFIVNSLGTLTPGKLHTQTFLDNLTQVENNVIRSAALLNNENPDDPQVMQKYHQMFVPPTKTNNQTTPPAAGPGTGGSDGNSPSGGGNTPPSPLNPDQQAKDKAFLATNPNPQQYAAFLGALIGHPVDAQAAANRLKAAQAGGTYSGSVVDQAAHGLAVGTGDVVQGVGDVVGLIANPLTRVVNDVAGTNVRPDFGQNLRDALGLPSPQGTGEQLVSAFNRGGTSALTMGGLAGAVAPYVSETLPTVGNALSRIGSAPLTDAASGATGAASAEGTRQAGGGPGLQTVAGLAGGMAALPVSSAVNALANRGPSQLSALARAGQEEGVTVNRAMANKGLQTKATAVGKTMVGAPMLRNGMAKVGDQLQGRVQALGDGGTVLEPQALGNTVQGAGLRYITQTGQQFNRLYGALSKATTDIRIAPIKSLQEVQGVIDNLSEMPNQNKAEVSYLQGLKSDLSQGLSINALRNLRTKLRQDLAKGDLTFGQDEARIKGIADAASQDISNGLEAAGKGDIASRFKQVDAAYRDRMDMIQNTIQKLIGKRGQDVSGEHVAGNLRTMAGPRGNASGLSRMLEQMTPDERSDVQATFANALGKDSSGSFSPAALVRNIEGEPGGAPKLPQAMRVALFGQDGAKSLENIAILAKEAKRVNNALGGSPTAIGNDYRSWLTNFVLGGGTDLLTGSSVKGVALGLGLQGAKMGRDALNARLLLSPKITGWLRAAPKTADAAAINSHFDRLKVIATRDPALAPEIHRLEDAITRSANQNVTPAVAASGTDNGNSNNQ